MSETTKEKIVAAANQLFAEKGYSGTSVREIAAFADVNISAINYYFESKEGLFETMVADFTNQKFSLVVSILEPPETAEEFKLRLTLFMKQFLALTQNEKDAFKMMNKNLEELARISPEFFSRTFLKVHEQFIAFVKASQEKNIIRSEFDCEMVTQILFGGLIDLIRGNDLRKHFSSLNIEKPDFFTTYINTVIEIFLNGMEVKN